MRTWLDFWGGVPLNENHKFLLACLVWLGWKWETLLILLLAVCCDADESQRSHHVWVITIIWPNIIIFIENYIHAIIHSSFVSSEMLCSYCTATWHSSRFVSIWLCLLQVPRVLHLQGCPLHQPTTAKLAHQTSSHCSSSLATLSPRNSGKLEIHHCSWFEYYLKY